MSSSPSQIRNILVLIGGTAFASAINFLAVPLLARFYDPSAFGALGAIVGVATIAAVAVHGRYHLAIPVTKDDRESRLLVLASVMLTLLLTGPAVLIITFFSSGNQSQLSILTFALAAAGLTLSGAIVEISTYWWTKNGQIKKTAANAVLRAVVTLLVQLCAFPFGAVGLLMGTLLGSMAATLPPGYDLLQVCRSVWQTTTGRDIWHVLVRNRSFPLLSMPQGVMAAVGWNLFPALLLDFSGAQVAGLYWLPFRVILTANTIIGSAYRQTTLPMLHRLEGETHAGMIRALGLHTLIFLTLSFIGCGILFVFGHNVIRLAFGIKWLDAVPFANWLALTFVAEFAKLPASCIIQYRRHFGQAIAWEASIALARYGVALPFLWSGNANAAIAAFSLVGLVGGLAFTARVFQQNWQGPVASVRVYQQ